MSESKTFTAEVPGDTDGLVVITLAHPLGKEDCKTVHLPKDSKPMPDDKVAVRREHAQSLIGAGYAQVDTEDPTAVQTALRNTLGSQEKPAEAAQDDEVDQDGAEAAPVAAAPADAPTAPQSTGGAVDATLEASDGKPEAGPTTRGRKSAQPSTPTQG